MNARLIFVILILVNSYSEAQTGSHIGFGNTYTYSENDGVDEFNFFVCGIASDGKVFFHGNTGSLFVKGNNYTYKLRIPPEFSATRIDIVFESGKNAYVALKGEHPREFYYVFSKDSLIGIHRFPQKLLVWQQIGDDVIASDNNHLYHFERDSLVCKVTVPENVGSIASFYTDKKNSLWIVIKTVKNFDFYSINPLWEKEFEFSLTRVENPVLTDTIRLHKQGHLILTNLSQSPFTNSSLIGASFQNHSPLIASFSFSEIGSQQYILNNLRNSDKQSQYLQYPDKLLTSHHYDSVTESFYFGSFDKPFRYFPYLRKYARLYNNISSTAINIVQQDTYGRIWTASYEGGLSVIDKDRMLDYKEDSVIYLPGSATTNNHIYLISEPFSKSYNDKKTGLIQIEMSGRKKFFASGSSGYCLSVSRDKKYFYYGTSGYSGLWKTDIPSLESGKPNWKKIDSTYGNYLQGVECFVEDTMGRVWMGGPTRGIAIYYPDKDRAKTWFIAKHETSFDFWSACTDNKGTVWLGTGQRGLMYHNDYSSGSIDIKNIYRIEHPLLPEGTRINQLKIWKNWLYIATLKDILLMDLDKWYTEKKISIRYINPLEGNFSARLQQNAVEIDKRDSSIWFATADMLYQWNIKEWLSLPVYLVTPNISLHTKSKDTALSSSITYRIKPSNNSLGFSVWFQSKDNMPRYMSVVLVREGDSIIFTKPNLETEFSYENLAPGNYSVYIQVCQSDGTVSIHRFPVRINFFWWQHWWIWFLTSLLLFTPIFFWIRTRNRARLSEEKVKRKEAEMEALRAEQEKKLSSLRIVSLSNQFRPHFILNALNTVGAELDNKPQAESVLSRLGESIDLIFSHSQQQKIFHSLSNEWKLVENVIDIHRMMYLKQLETYLPDKNKIETFKHINVPLGLLQVPVENSLLHGLSNREQGPWNLKIDINEIDSEIIIIITDNGVGRERAAQLSNFRKHGTGTKNLESILTILNKNKTQGINIRFEDNIFRKDNKPYGTRTIITIPKNFSSEF